MNRAEDLIETAWQARREGRHPDAEHGLLQAITVSREAGLRMELIRALKALAHVVRDRGQHERALPLYEEAVALSREEGNALLLAHTVRHLGDLHREAGRLTDAAPCYQEALSLYRATSAAPALDFANALRPAAILKEAEGDVKAARQLWSDARLLYEAAGVRPAVEECDRRLSQLG
jgi:tetratricopeptide (TPR) repeat protein